MKQIDTKKLSGKIVVKTGLHIGAGNDKVEIGGMDNPIIRNPLTHEPYIPGSSIKGKMRSLMEWKFDKLKSTGGKVCSCGLPECKVCRVFGSANTKSEEAKDRGRAFSPAGVPISKPLRKWWRRPLPKTPRRRAARAWS